MIQITNALPGSVPLLLEKNNRHLLERFVEIPLDYRTDVGVPHYAAYWLLNGKIDERIAHFKALEAKSSDPKREAEILAYLYRAKGDLPAALDAARRADLDDLVDHLLVQAGDWKKLAERQAVGEKGGEFEKLALRATYYRITGEKKGLNDTFAELKKLAAGAAIEDTLHFQIAKVLLLNGRATEALELLGKGRGVVTAFEVLCARNQYKEAFDLVDKARFTEAKELPALEIAEARTRYLLGDKEKAVPIFAKYAGMIKEGVDITWLADLIDAENRCGLTDEAFDHAAKILTVLKNQGFEAQVFAKLYPSKRQIAADLWAGLPVLAPMEKPPAAMKRLRALLDGNLPAKEVIEFLDKSANHPEVLLPNLARDLERPMPWPLVMAEIAAAARMEDRAIAILEKAAGSEAKIRLGDLFADRKEWDKAATAYRKAWQADRGNPLPLWLAGWC